MDAVRVSALRESLAGTGWLERTGDFAGALRSAVSGRASSGLLLVGTPRYEPWHLAAHLDAGDRELAGLAHDRLTVPEAGPEPFELVQHLVSTAAGTTGRARSRLARLAERLTAPPALRW